MANIEAVEWLKAAITDIGTRQVLIEQAVARIEERLSSPDRKPAGEVQYAANKEQLAKLLAKVLGDDDKGNEPKP